MATDYPEREETMATKQIAKAQQLVKGQKVPATRVAQVKRVVDHTGGATQRPPVRPGSSR